MVLLLESLMLVSAVSPAARPGAASDACLAQKRFFPETCRRHSPMPLRLRGGGLTDKQRKRRKMQIESDMDLDTSERAENTAALSDSDAINFDDPEVVTAQERKHDTVTDDDWEYLSSSSTEHPETTAAWCSTIDSQLAFENSSDVSDLRSSEAARDPPADWQPTMRDLQKFSRHLQKLNGVHKLDLNPPTGFDDYPDVMVVGGTSGDSKELAAVQTFNFAAGRWRTEMPLGFNRHAPAAAKWRDKVFVFGGICDDYAQVAKCLWKSRCFLLL
jgi:hypothetical protein